MADKFRRVGPGQPFAPSARVWNAMLGAAEAYIGQGASGGSGSFDAAMRPIIVKIRNMSGDDRERHEVLAIDQSTFTREENQNQFDSFPLLDCVEPEAPKHDGHFVVLLEPIRDGKVGRAAIAGVVPVRLTINNANDKWADIRDASYVLKTGTWGNARILWKESGTGTGKWGQVLLQAGYPAVIKAVLSEDLLDNDEADATLDGETITVKDDDLIPTGKKIADNSNIRIGKNGANDWILINSETCPVTA